MCTPRAESVVKEILGALEVGIDKLLVIPGNHDIEWSPNPLAVIDYESKVSRDNYAVFLRLLRDKVPEQVELLALEARSGRRKLRVLGFDSNFVEGPDAAGVGYIEKEAFNFAQHKLETDSIVGFESVYTWIAVHHHVFPATIVSLSDARRRKITIMGNAPELQYYANKWSVDLILHGHEHQPSVTVSRRWPTDAGLDFSPITVISAGSVGAKREHLAPFSRNQYFVIYRRTSDVIVRSRYMGDAGVKFVPHNDIILPR